MAAPNVLVLFAHPVFERSRANRYLVDAIRDLDGVTFRDLYEDYPTLQIDVEREQADLVAHDVIVFQHPFYWYSAPAIVKEWQDLVLEYGFAYGVGGTRLRGKVTFNAITTGGPAQAYRPDGYNHFTIRQLLAPFEQTARLCNMRFLAPFIVHSSLKITDRESMARHAREYRRLVELARDHALDLDRLEQAACANDPDQYRRAETAERAT